MSTDTIGTGLDHDTVTEWESTTSVSLTEDEIGVVTDTSLVTTTNWLEFTGATGQPTYSRTLTTSDTAGHKHAGVYATDRHYFDLGAGYPAIYEQDFTFEWQIVKIETGGSARGVRTDSSTGILIANCIIWNDQTGSGDGALYIEGNATIRNCAVVAAGEYACSLRANGATVENCTMIGGDHGIEVISGVGSITVENVYARGTVSAFSDLDTFDWTLQNCAISDTSQSDAEITQSVAYNTTNFTNVTGGSEDLHLPTTSSALYNVGHDNSGKYTDDYEGDTRTQWDIGADGLVVAGGSTSHMILLLGVG